MSGHGDRTGAPRVQSFVTGPGRARMRALRAEGYSLRAIATATGAPPRTVLRHVGDIPAPEGGWSDGSHEARLDHARIRALREAGWTYERIADELGCSQTMAFYAVNPGARVRRRPARTPRLTGRARRKGARAAPFTQARVEAVADEVMNLVAQNVTYREITARLGIPAPAITKLVGSRADRMRFGTIAQRSEAVLAAVARVSGVPADRILGQDQTYTPRARHIAWWLMRRQGASLPKIGALSGGFDHTTVLAACRRIDAVVATIGAPKADTLDAWAAHLWAAPRRRRSPKREG